MKWLAKLKKLPAKVKPYAKSIVGGLGLVLTVASAWVDPGSTVGQVVTAVIAVASAYGVYRVPNSKVVPAAVTALKAAMAKDKPAPSVADVVKAVQTDIAKQVKSTPPPTA